jgi:asparagine synthase (glutamine-hydrolysing)
MCGIAGILKFNNEITAKECQEVSQIGRALHHRGPDSLQIEKLNNTGVFAGVRLRITDAQNPDSDLPLVYDNRYVIVFNGEIYNHQEIRAKLSSVTWRTQSDTETLAAAYAQWGEDCLSFLEGMYGFAIYDKLTHETFCARDVTGQKPFYYMLDEKRFVFSSEINALLYAVDHDFEFCSRGLANFIANRMILGRHTHIQDIYKLEPGSFMRISKDGDVQCKRYHKLKIGTQTHNDIEDVKGRVRKALEEGCKQSFDIEHPAALLLSGGIDSTAVLAAMMQKGIRPHTFSIGFEKFEGDNHGIPSLFNEFDASDYVAQYFETSHHRISITPQDYLNAIDEWSKIVDEPLDATDAPLLYILFQNINAEGYRLVFSGSGPDEIFDGYGHGSALSNIPLEKLADAYCDKFSWNFGVDYARLMPDFYQGARRDIKKYFEQCLSWYSDENLNSLQATQILNFHGRLSAYEFKQMDLTSMHFGIEARSPLVDKRILDVAFDFAPELKAYKDEEKWIYKKAWEGLVPDPIINREKVGFPTPMEFWFTSEFKNRVSKYLGDGSLIRELGIIDEMYLDKLIEATTPDLRALSYRLYVLEKMLQHQHKLMRKINIIVKAV